jgi:hypothetical protein
LLKNAVAQTCSKLLNITGAQSHSKSLKVARSCLKITVAQICSNLLKNYNCSKSLKVARSCLKIVVAQSCSKFLKKRSCSKLLEKRNCSKWFRGETIIRGNVPNPKIEIKFHEIRGNVTRGNENLGNVTRGN